MFQLNQDELIYYQYPLRNKESKNHMFDGFVILSKADVNLDFFAML